MARAAPCSVTKSSLPWPVPVLLLAVSAGQQRECWAQPALETSTSFASPAASRQSLWRRVETTNKSKSLPSSLNVLSASRKGWGQPLSCHPVTLKCFKQNRADGGVLLKGLGCQLQAAARGLSLGLGTGKTKLDQHLAAPGLAETESEEESSCSPGENKQKQDRRREKPWGSEWGAEPPFPG